VVCPFHAYKFALGDGRGLDTELHVRSYPAEIRDGRIYVTLASPD
jgi:nitrite reductase/ring-hydroxylating ferredoxin subunit